MIFEALDKDVTTQLVDENLPEKESVVFEESSAAQNMRIASENMKEISDKVGKGLKDVAGAIKNNTTMSL